MHRKLRLVLRSLLPPATLAVLGLASLGAHADPTLPYTTRTRSYDATTTTVRGDLRLIGTGGAAIGLADSFISAQDNPAGLALTLPGADVQISSNWVRDELQQGTTNTLYNFNAGIAWSGYPWGFSMGFVSPFTEGQTFTQGLAVITTREFRFGVARSLFNNRLSIGASPVIGQAEKILGNQGFATYTFGGVLGFQLQLPHRFLIGLSGSLPMHYAEGLNNTTTPVADFFQEVQVAARISLGWGWIPNRFFRTGVSLLAFGPSFNAALLRDESATFVDRWTFQPRAGASYQWLDYAELRSTVYAGGGLEVPRIHGAPLRPHISGGIEVIPWVIILAAGVDYAPGYINYILGVGVDVLRLSEKLDLIPSRVFPPRGGFLPRFSHLSDEGLPRPLVKDWKPTGPPIDAIQVGLDLPQRVGEKAKAVSETFAGTARGSADPPPPPTPAKTMAKGKSKKTRARK